MKRETPVALSVFVWSVNAFLFGYLAGQHFAYAAILRRLDALLGALR